MLLTLALVGRLQAQDSAPLTGPLVAVNTAEQDRLLLYDTAADTVRSLHMGEG